jgi:hypothetical protein
MDMEKLSGLELAQEGLFFLYEEGLESATSFEEYVMKSLFRLLRAANESQVSLKDYLVKNSSKLEFPKYALLNT